MPSPHTVDTVEARFRTLWDRTDRIFSLLTPDALLARPIALRHPFLFYLGHLPAFAWNHVCRGVLGWDPFNPSFDEIFDRGIDPDVDDPTRCHDHPEVPARWPDPDEVTLYRDRVRKTIVDAIPDVAGRAAVDSMAARGRVLAMAIEHELMHQETLLYMVQQLDPAQKIRMPLPVASPASSPRRARPAAIPVPAGQATLGAGFDDVDFGWDNEFPATVVPVPAFTIDALPVTNAEFLDFVERGAYDDPRWWTSEDWIWKTAAGLAHPVCWTRAGEEWQYRAVADVVPLALALEWPVYVSLAEARAYARWAGARLPSEAEYHRAAYGTPEGVERRFPWGDAPPGPDYGNVDFTHWSPQPVGAFPLGASAWGVQELIGNGWEWTDTPFAPFPGFTAYIERYPGYSADFFDGKHYVLKGGSWATAKELTRRSFRNWFQARYPYVFAKFRCVRSAD